ncbi:retrovirus-related pol polyprotein from transposon TNT 1-94 [Tanacetum coccineum]
MLREFDRNGNANLVVFVSSIFKGPEFEGYGPKTSKSVSKDTYNEVMESPDASLVEELVSNDKLEKKISFPTVAKINFVRPQQQEKPVRKLVKNIVPRAVLMKTGLRPLSAARPVNTAHPKTTVYSARPTSFNTAKGKVNTARPKAVNTARPNTAVVNAVRENQGHPQKEDQGYVDSGCSRHMTGNMSYLSDFKEFDGGYVTFGGGAKGGRITGKGTLKTGKLDFEDVYFVKELQFTWVFFLASKDETSSILKSFITQIENLVDKKVKIIRCDNGTKFKNRVISEFCEKKGIKREFSIARTHQQNGVAKRRNRTIIEAARTMLADSKLPTTFWAKAVNTAYYVQNRVLVVKPHNKTPYELFRGRTPSLSFMKPFGCHVTILNTLDHLGKFDGKITSNEDNHNLTNDARKKDDEGGIDDQERTKNSAQDVNTTGPSINTASTNFNTGSLNINIVSLTVPTAPLESTYADFFGDESELDLSNIATTYPIPTTPNTRIHKDHSLDDVLGDCDVWIEAIKLFLAYASFKDFVVYQMDVKSAFLYDKIEKEVYVCQPLGFEDPEFPDKVYKMSSMRELTFFLGLQVTQKDDGIFISQEKYVDEILKKFGFSTMKTTSTPMETSKPLLKDAEAEDVDVHLYRSMIGSLMYLIASKPDIMFAVCLWYPKDSPFDLEAYTDSDYAGASLDMKSTKGGCKFLGRTLISLQCNKQTIVVNSTTEAKYVAAASFYGQVLWIQN